MVTDTIIDVTILVETAVSLWNIAIVKQLMTAANLLTIATLYIKETQTAIAIIGGEHVMA